MVPKFSFRPILILSIWRFLSLHLLAFGIYLARTVLFWVGILQLTVEHVHDIAPWSKINQGYLYFILGVRCMGLRAYNCRRDWYRDDSSWGAKRWSGYRLCIKRGYNAACWTTKSRGRLRGPWCHPQPQLAAPWGTTPAARSRGCGRCTCREFSWGRRWTSTCPHSQYTWLSSTSGHTRRSKILAKTELLVMGRKLEALLGSSVFFFRTGTMVLWRTLVGTMALARTVGRSGTS